MFVLHLVDPGACGDEGLLACAAAMSISSEGIRHHAWILGTAADERRAWAAGIVSTDRVPPGAWGSSVRGLRCLAAARFDHESQGQPDILQCWSAAAFSDARSVFGGEGGPARVLTLSAAPDDGRMLGGRDSDLSTAREVVVSMDLATRRVVSGLMGTGSDGHRWIDAVRVVEPPVPGQNLPSDPDRRTLRESLGIDGANAVVGVLADPPERADALRMAFLAGVVNAAGQPVTILMRRGARQERRGAEYVRAHGRRWGLLPAELTLAELAAASDVCIVDRAPARSGSPPISSCGPVGLSVAMGADVPVVAFPGAAEHGLSDDRWPLVVAESDSLTRFAHPLLRTIQDPAIRSGLARGMQEWRERARERDGFRRVLAEIWLEAANVPMVGMG